MSPMIKYGSIATAIVGFITLAGMARPVFESDLPPLAGMDRVRGIDLEVAQLQSSVRQDLKDIHKQFNDDHVTTLLLQRSILIGQRQVQLARHDPVGAAQTQEQINDIDAKLRRN